ncbi:MAG TPA: tetratricopeptide repeat protein, partial [Spirochaetota bacterium]|nr:tetratricopeptide repeat protein [Spirochaetota bacterium]
MKETKEDNIIINHTNYQIEYKNKKNLSIKGVTTIPDEEIFFDINYKKELKNFLITFNSNSKMNSMTNEIKFYFRYVDDKNYCSFSVRGGQYIKFAVIGNGETRIQTSYIKISDINIFQDKFNFILLCFEESTTVLIDNVIILHIEHTPEIEGKIGIQFLSPKKDDFNLNLENFYITDDILTFEAIIEMPKNSNVYFMEANDFYEQNRYDLSLIYYKKGLLFGKGDDKIYNRVANLLFLIEEYKEAEKYYNEALRLNPDKIDYKINLGRTLLRLNKDNEASKLLEAGIENGVRDIELFIDYSALWMKVRKYDEALKYLKMAQEIDSNNFSVLYKTGKCLIEMGHIDAGKK